MQKILFIGGFACGKRTLVNALLRKQVLNTSVVPGIGSGFVTEIVSGDSERCFSVNKDGSRKLLNLDDLEKTMTDDFDVDPHLRDTEYIVHKCSAQASNLTFTVANLCMQDYGYKYGHYGEKVLDFPCLKNDAVVYVLNASMLFDQEDRRYIERNFGYGASNNVFFCVNRMDTVAEKYLTEIKEFTKERLKDVFTVNGIFDEILYHNRVFYISAYNSLNARLGKTSHTLSGDVDVKDIDTGVPEFEYTLRKFLQQQPIEQQRAMEQQK